MLLFGIGQDVRSVKTLTAASPKVFIWDPAMCMVTEEKYAGYAEVENVPLPVLLQCIRC